MKKLITFLGLCLVSLVVGLTIYSVGKNLRDTKDVGVVKEKGFMVLKDNSEDESTIVAKITDEDSDGDGYVNATNVYDKNDTIAIGKGFGKGELVLITFNNDDVVKVELNELVIGDKVKGQKIK